jgi:hypothetical protein
MRHEARDPGTLSDQDLRALTGAALSAMLDHAERAMAFHGACDSNAELAEERHWRRAHARLLLERERRRGPLLQAPGALTDKVRSCRLAHCAEIDALTREGRHLAEAQRCAGRRAARARSPGERRTHHFEARLLARQLVELNRSRRTLRRLVADADRAIGLSEPPNASSPISQLEAAE